MSYPERVAYDFLVSRNVSFVHQKLLFGFYVDFLIDNSIVLEIDGEYWHDAEKDAKRDAVLLANKFKVLRIKSKERIEDRITELLNLV